MAVMPTRSKAAGRVGLVRWIIDEIHRAEADLVVTFAMASLRNRGQSGVSARNA